MTELAIMGFARVLPHLKRFWDLLRQADQSFQKHRPDAVVLIDYPGFNWWIARRAKKYGIPVFYYGTPQIWGWATHRVRKLRRLVDHVLCKLPFEPEWYRQHDCTATYVGHPYFDDFLNRRLDDAFIRELGDEPLVAVLPGSRKHEVENNLPAFLRTIEFVHRTVPNARFAIASYNHDQANMARNLIEAHNGEAEPEVYIDRTRELMNKATCCLACSGSVSLELLHEAKPTVIHYKIDRLINFLQRHFRRCKFITLVNLLTSERRFETDDHYDPNDTRYLAEAPFPEYFTVEDRSAEMAHHLIRWLTNERTRQEVVDYLRPLRDSFAKPGASRLAANYILDELSKPGICRPHLPTDAKVA
jgi:lipid-A-disaccharide synthase